MRLVAPGVWQFRFLWPGAFNAYFIEGEGEGVVVDASTRWSWPLMKKQLKGRPVTGVVLTHGHPDHQGCAAKICERWQVPLGCHALDADSAEGKAPLVRQRRGVGIDWQCVVGREAVAGSAAAGGGGPGGGVYGVSSARAYAGAHGAAAGKRWRSWWGM